MLCFCEICETESLQDNPDALADVCDSCVDAEAGPITTMRDLIESGALDN